MYTFTKLASRSLLSGSRCHGGVGVVAGLEVGVGVGVGPLVWSLLSDLRVAGADALSWAEPEAKWPKEVLAPGVCARIMMPLRLAGLEVRVGVGVGAGPLVWSLLSGVRVAVLLTPAVGPTHTYLRSDVIGTML